MANPRGQCHPRRSHSSRSPTSPGIICIIYFSVGINCLGRVNSQVSNIFVYQYSDVDAVDASSSGAPYMQVKDTSNGGRIPVKRQQRKHYHNPVVSPNINIQTSTPNYVCDDLGEPEEDNLIDSLKTEPDEVNPLNDESPLLTRRRYKRNVRHVPAARTPSSQLIERAEALIGASSGSFEELQKSQSNIVTADNVERAESQGDGRVGRSPRKVAVVRPQRHSPEDDDRHKKRKKHKTEIHFTELNY